MSTQLIGFSIGGVARRFLVSPPSMIWPANLVNCALFNTLHSQQYAGMGTRGGLSRERFFMYWGLLHRSSGVSENIIWFYFIDDRSQISLFADFFPGYLCQYKIRTRNLSLIDSLYLVQALSYFSWATWIAPENTSKLFDHLLGLRLLTVSV